MMGGMEWEGRHPRRRRLPALHSPSHPPIYQRWGGCDGGNDGGAMGCGPS